MSDTSRFATVNDTVTPANSSGFDGFPAPFSTGSTGAGTGNPIQLAYQDAVGLWHRVKNWSMASTWTMVLGTITYAFGSGPSTPLSGNASSVLQFISTNVAHDFSGPPGPLTPPDNTSSFGLQIMDLGSPAGVPFGIAGTGNTIWPSIQFSAGLNSSTLPGQVAFSSYLSVPGFTPSGSFTAQLIVFNPVTNAPVTYNFTMYYDAGTNPPTSFSPGNMSYTASEFWQYGSLANGSPVYNTGSGQFLQSPLN